MTTLTELAAHYLPAVEDEMHRVVGGGPEHFNDYYQMLSYHLGWTNGAGAGKRIRPLLALLCCAAAGGDWQQALPVAAAIELIHNFSLIHDDIQDNSPTRRGLPTVWTKWGMAQAINAGDAMFTLAHLAPQGLTARGVAPAVALWALERLDQTCLALTQGQYLDMSFEGRQRVTVAEYLTMIEGKTGALIAASTQLGARLGGAEAGRLGHFHDYGLSLGLAFQIQDDLLGIWGDEALTGKSTASDLETRKKTLPVVYGLERSEAFAKAYARPHQPGEPLAEMAALLTQLGAKDYVEQQASLMTQAALDHLEAAKPSEPAGAALRELTAQLLSRQK
jgi:geranylgeranyl diphosphate synthase, type I